MSRAKKIASFMAGLSIPILLTLGFVLFILLALKASSGSGWLNFLDGWQF